VRVLSRLFRRRFLEELQQLHQAGKLQFFGEHVALADAQGFKQWLAPMRKCEWVVYAKRPFAGPSAVLAYLSRYTHRVAISNSCLLALDERGVSLRWKDYRANKVGRGKTRYKAMTLSPEEFMRRLPRDDQFKRSTTSTVQRRARRLVRVHAWPRTLACNPSDLSRRRAQPSALPVSLAQQTSLSRLILMAAQPQSP